MRVSELAAEEDALARLTGTNPENAILKSGRRHPAYRAERRASWLIV
jgi:hypothetical protein